MKQVMKAAMKKGPRKEGGEEGHRGGNKEGGEEGHRGEDGKATVSAKKAAVKAKAMKAMKAAVKAKGKGKPAEPARAEKLAEILQDLTARVSVVEQQQEQQKENLQLQHQQLQQQQEEQLALTRLVRNPRHLARVPPPRPSPRKLAYPWQEHYCDVYKCPYFWNVEAGYSAWVPPA